MLIQRMQCYISKVFIILGWFYSTQQKFSLPALRVKTINNNYFPKLSVVNNALYLRSSSKYNKQHSRNKLKNQYFNSKHFVYRFCCFPGVLQYLDFQWKSHGHKCVHFRTVFPRAIFSQSKVPEDLITLLSCVPSFFIIAAPNFKYRCENMEVKTRK